MNVEGSTFPEQVPAACIIRYSPFDIRHVVTKVKTLDSPGGRWYGAGPTAIPDKE